MQAVADRVIVHEYPPETVRPSGLIIPETAAKETSRGRVLSIGNKVRDVRQGAEVLYTKYDGFEIKDQNGRPVTVLHENEIAAVMVP